MPLRDFQRIIRLVVTAAFALPGPRLLADTVELKTGEHLEGTFRQASASSVMIEAAGQAITIPLEKVQAIYFGAAKPVAQASPAPWQDALDAVRALRSIAETGIPYAEYASRVRDAKVRVDRYLVSQGSDPPEARRAIRTAMLEYELASHAGKSDVLLGWDGSSNGKNP